MDQSSFPKQTRADQDSRSDVDQDLPVDQTRKEDDASPVKPKQPSLPKPGERPCAPPPEKPKEPLQTAPRRLRLQRARPFYRDEDSFKNELIKGTTFRLRGGDGGCSGSTVADQGQGGSATTGSSGGVKKMAAAIICFLFLLIISIPGGNSAQLCDRCAHQSDASYFPAPSAYSSAACGYGPLAIAGSNSNNRTGFVLSRRAFKALAKQGSETEIFKHRILHLEYKWVPCAFKSQNLTLRVEESSQYPNYLAVQILNQGGQTEIGAIDVLGGNNVGSGFMSRKHGAVWETKLDRAGPLVFRFIVRDTFSTQRILTEQPIPANWKPGMSYDTGVQFTAIAREICDVCDNGKWREM